MQGANFLHPISISFRCEFLKAVSTRSFWHCLDRFVPFTERVRRASVSHPLFIFFPLADARCCRKIEYRRRRGGGDGVGSYTEKTPFRTSIYVFPNLSNNFYNGLKVCAIRFGLRNAVIVIYYDVLVCQRYYLLFVRQ